MKFWDTGDTANIKEEFNYDDMKRKFIENLDYLKTMSVEEQTLYKKWMEWNGPCTTVLSLSFSTITQIIKIPLAAIGLFVIFFTQIAIATALIISYHMGPPRLRRVPPKSLIRYFLLHT